MKYRDHRGYFTEEAKRAIVMAFESGKSDIKSLCAAHGITGHSTIIRWCRRYGERSYPIMERSPIEKLPIPKNEETTLLLSQIRVLERELKEARFKQATLETLIDIAERHYSIDIKKNSGGKPFSMWPNPGEANP
jgi:transposase-like protein